MRHSVKYTDRHEHVQILTPTPTGEPISSLKGEFRLFGEENPKKLFVFHF